MTLGNVFLKAHNFHAPEDTPESRQILPLLGEMISTHRLSHPAPSPNATAGPIPQQ
jgi:hypothetical protein